MPADLEGRSYGPAPVDVGVDGVARFVAATGDDRARWVDHAPPAFASAALFAVAPRFLADPDVASHTRSLIHTEQMFRWHRPLAAGERLEVIGRVTGVRTRRALTLVTFGFEAGSADPWLEGESTFLLSDEAAGSAEEGAEPSHDERAIDEGATAAPLPEAGGVAPEVLRSASRADLVRYAGVTGDWNPIHWDHEAAVAAGLGRIVVHGLLMASWITQAACRHGSGPDPIRSLQLRFRRPLRPAAQARIAVTVDEVAAGRARLALRLSHDGTDLVTAKARVTA